MRFSPWLSRSSFRRWGAIAALLAVLLLGARILLLQGWIRPVRVVSGSMAPALLGPYFQITCGDCGYPVRIDATQATGEEMVVCPNCGYAKNELTQATLHRGERVLIDRGAYWLRNPRRFEAVALLEPHEPYRLVVKRIVALPGETVEVRGGELYIDGRLVRKSWQELRELAVVVHDDRYRPRNTNLSFRWQDDRGRWTPRNGGYHYPGDLHPLTDTPNRSQFAWLTYHHWRCSPLPGLRSKASPVLDDYGFNLGPPRTLNPVTDLLLRCRVQTVGEGCLAVSLHDGREAWEVRLWPQRGRGVVVREGEEVARGALSRFDGKSFLLEAAVCDGQVLAAINGRPLLSYRYEPTAEGKRPPSTPIALGALGLSAEVWDVVVSRDVFYLPPPGRGRWRREKPLSPGEYVLLGDNAPLAEDSRTWPASALSRNALLGPILRWPFAQSPSEVRRER